jgi:hypothetical protein
VEAMLRDVGFQRTERKHPELIRQGRLIIHAWK